MNAVVACIDESRSAVPQLRKFLSLRVSPVEQPAVDIPDELANLIGLTPGDYEFFQRWGYRKLAVQMLVNEAKTLADDPQLETKEGRASHEWVINGNTGALPFDTCLEWAGLYEVNGEYLDDRIRAEMLSRPGAIARALTRVESVISANEQVEATTPVGLKPMTLAERIEFVYSDDDFTLEFEDRQPGSPMFMAFSPPELDFERPGRGFE